MQNVEHGEHERDWKHKVMHFQKTIGVVVGVVVTVTLQSLVNQAVEQGAAVVAESRASVGVVFKLVFRPIVLRK